MLYEYFYGEYGMITSFQGFVDSTIQRFPILSDQSSMYNLTVMVAALVAGVVVYAVLQGLTKLLAVGLNDYIAVQEASDTERKHAAKEVAIRWILRVATLIVWVVHWLIFAGVIVPFCILLARVELSDLLTAKGWINGFLGVTLLFVSIHMHVIFMRAMVLRPRLFGSENEIIEAMADRNIEFPGSHWTFGHSGKE